MLGRWAKIRDEFSLVSNTTTQQRRCNGKPYVTESFAHTPPPPHIHTHTRAHASLRDFIHPVRYVIDEVSSRHLGTYFAGRLREGFQTTYNLFACLNYRGYVNNYASRVLFGIII